MMRLRKLFCTICAASVTCTAIPAVPAAAEAHTDAGTAGSYLWEHTRKDDRGVSEMNCTDDGKFTAAWKKISGASYSMGPSMDTVSWETAGDLLYTYACEFSPNGDDYLAVCGSFADSPDEFCIIDAWNGSVPSQGEKIGEFTVTGAAAPVVYDIYLSEEQKTDSTGNVIDFSRYQSIRRTNTAPPDTTTVIGIQVNLTQHLNAWKPLGMNSSSVDSLMFRVTAGDSTESEAEGKAELKMNSLEIRSNPDSTQDLNESGTTADGHIWYHWNASNTGSSKMNTADNGTFTCEWNNIENVVYECRETLSDPIDPEMFNQISCYYLAEAKITGSYYYGVCGHLEEPSAEFMIIDYWNTPDGSEFMPENQLVGTYTAYGLQYHLYKQASNRADVSGKMSPVIYWAIRTKEQPSDSALNPAADAYEHVDLTSHFPKWENLGLKVGKLTQTGLTATAYASATGEQNSGTIAFTQNSFFSTPKSRGITNDGYIWEYRANEGGWPDLRMHENGSFDLQWSRRFFDLLISPSFHSGFNWKEYGKISYRCTYEAAFEQSEQGAYPNAFFGISGSLLDPEVRFDIYENYYGYTPEQNADYVGTYEADGRSYLLFKRQTLISTLEKSWFDTVYECWAADGLLTENQTTVQSELTLSEHFKAWEQLGLEVGKLLQVGAVITAQDTNGTAAITENKAEFEKTPAGTDRYETGKTFSGADWQIYSQEGIGDVTLDAANEEILYKNSFLAKISHAQNALVSCGEKLPNPIPWEQYQTLTYAYEASQSNTGEGFSGIYGQTDDGTDFFIIENWGTMRPAFTGAVGDITVSGKLYTVCRNTVPVPGTDKVHERIWCIPKTENSEKTIRLELPEYFAAIESLGLKIGTPTYLAVALGCSNADAAATKTCTLDVIDHQLDYSSDALPQQPAVTCKGDANLDGILDVSDVVLVARFVSADSTAKITDQGKTNADIDSHPGLDTDDIDYLLRVIVKLIQI